MDVSQYSWDEGDHLGRKAGHTGCAEPSVHIRVYDRSGKWLLASPAQLQESGGLQRIVLLSPIIPPPPLIVRFHELGIRDLVVAVIVVGSDGIRDAPDEELWAFRQQSHDGRPIQLPRSARIACVLPPSES